MTCCGLNKASVFDRYPQTLGTYIFEHDASLHSTQPFALALAAMVHETGPAKAVSVFDTLGRSLTFKSNEEQLSLPVKGGFALLTLEQKRIRRATERAKVIRRPKKNLNLNWVHSEAQSR